MAAAVPAVRSTTASPEELRRAAVIDCGGCDELPPALLGILADGGDGARSLVGTTPAIRQLVQLARWQGRIACEPPITARFIDAPVSLAIADGKVVAAPAAQAGSHERLLDTCEWIRAARGATIEVDLSAMAHINSQMVAWLLRIAQGMTPRRLTLTGVSASVATQLRQLRLEHLLAFA